MVLTTWKLRTESKEVDHDKLYEKNPTLFSLEIHHGGFFSMGESRTYVDGKISYVDFIDGDAFSVLELTAMLQELGYVKKVPMWYHFKAPNNDLDVGLHALGSDNDVRFLLKYVSKYKLIEIYVEEGKTNLLRSSLMMIEQNDDDIVMSQPTGKNKSAKKLFSDDVYVPMQVETEWLKEIPPL